MVSRPALTKVTIHRLSHQTREEGETIGAGGGGAVERRSGEIRKQARKARMEVLEGEET